VAILACDPGVFPRKRKTRFVMVQRFPVWLPMDDLKISAVVLGMARSALLAAIARLHPHRVHSAMLVQTLADFRVAFQTLHFRCAAAQIVAFCAVCGARQRLMPF